MTADKEEILATTKWSKFISVQTLALAFLCAFFCLTPRAQAESEAASLAKDSQVRTYYHQFHQYPELGKEETKTAAFIRAELSKFGYTNLLSIDAAPTTVIAVLDTGEEGPVICLRSEMDARKCQEKTGLEFASKIPGVMHNCGHDAHAAMLLETAHRLIQNKNKFKGKIVLLFQPAEECPGGADEIVADGILKRLGVQAIFAQHCSNGSPEGTYMLSGGPILAGSSFIKVEINGIGGHAAVPSARDDLASVASLITLELEKLPGRCTDPIYTPAVCAITTSDWSSSQSNVAPETITLGGTIRAFFGMDEKLFRGKSYRELVQQLVNGLASAYGVEAKATINNSVPVTVNNSSLCKRLSAALEAEGMKILPEEKGMFAEDFSFYTPTLPSAYFGLGIAKDNLGKDNAHSSHFTIHEDCLEKGVSLLEHIAEAINGTQNASAFILEQSLPTGAD